MPVIDTSVGLTLDRILVATDFAGPSTVAFEYAKALARRFSSRLVLAHVIDLSVATRSERAVVGSLIDDMRRSGTDNMERTLTELESSGFRATGQTVEAHNTAAAIIGLSQQIKADMIVMGTHARHGLSRAILGSCAEGVIRHATCPVLTVGPYAKRPARGSFSFSNIVFATDLRQDAAEKAAVALTIGEDSFAKIHLCYALEKPGDSISRTLEAQLQCENALRKLVPQGAYEHCDTDCVVEHGDAAPHILDVAGKVDADLIVMGARRSTNWLATLSEGVVGHVLAKATCPVMTVCTS
jgi:nucleotide-binding universal stress UspA family protein